MGSIFHIQPALFINAIEITIAVVFNATRVNIVSLAVTDMKI